MTIPVQSPRKIISGSGWVNPLTHEFPIENATDVEVFADSDQLTLGSHYSVSGVGDPAGYTITIVDPGLWAPDVWVLNVLYPINQPSDVDQGGQFGLRFENALDRMARSDQVIWARAQRSVAVSPTTPLDFEMEMPAPLAGAIIGFDENGQLTTYVPDDLGTPTIEVTAFARTLLDDASAAEARATLGIEASVNTVHYVASVAAMAELDNVKVKAAYLGAPGAEGQFKWVDGDFAARIAADPLQGVYVKKTTVAATAGAWVRQTKYLTPRMFGAAGNGIADDRAAVQAAWTHAATLKLPCRMEGLEYNCSEAVCWDSNLVVLGEGAVMYPTAWPESGGFINNVWMPPESETRRIVSNVYLSDLIADGSKLAAPASDENTNLFGGARGVSNLRFVRCVARKMREGSGGGTGGGGFGVETGATNVVYEDCVAEDCFRAIRIGGQSGDWGSPTFATKQAIGIVMRNFIARRCGCAVFAHAVGSPTADRNVSDLSIFDVVISGILAINCGSYPWRAFDYVANPTIAPQKQGVFVFAYGRNIYIEKARVRVDATWTTTDADWLGRVGYPGVGTSYIGAGLSGNVGTVVQGHGRNVVIRDVSIDGNFDTIYKCERAITFGDLATVPPTNGTGSVEQWLLDDIRHVRGTHNYVFDGQASLDNSKMSVQIKGLMRVAAPVTGVIGPTGTATLTNVRIQDVRPTGIKIEGTAVEYLANGNAFVGTGVGDDVSYGTQAFGGGYSATGTKIGASYELPAGVWRSSTNVATTSSHLAIYNTNGLVGTVSSNGTATAYNTSSDETLKDFIGEFSPERAIEIIKLDPVRDFHWKSDGSYAVGWGAQTSYAVSKDLAAPGGWIDPETQTAVDKGFARWAHPVTGEPVEQGWTGYGNRRYYDLKEELQSVTDEWQGRKGARQPEIDAILAEIAEIEANETPVEAKRIDAVYVPWGVDQSKRTPYLWAAVSHLIDELKTLKEELASLRSSTETKPN